jgi:hypothetical protein
LLAAGLDDCEHLKSFRPFTHHLPLNDEQDSAGTAIQRSAAPADA